MNILCVSDLIDPLIYNSNAHNNFPDVDVILCAGDLPMDYIDFIVSVFNKPTYFIFGNHDLKEFHYYHGKRDTITHSNSNPNNGIFSSPTCEATNLEFNHGAIYAGFKNLILKDFVIKNRRGKPTPLLITGISGSRKYNNGLNQYTDFQMYLHLFALLPRLFMNKILYGRYTDIFLTHATPLNIHDHKDPCHVGFKPFNWFLKKFKPRYMVHGHIHLYDQREERVGDYGNTTIVNAYAHYVLSIPTDIYCKTTELI